MSDSVCVLIAGLSSPLPSSVGSVHISCVMFVLLCVHWWCVMQREATMATGMRIKLCSVVYIHMTFTHQFS